MPIRLNPFRRQDENVRPPVGTAEPTSNGVPTKPIEIKEKEPIEYKLSEINDSGVFIPPSPPERKSFWSTASSRSTTSSIARVAYDESEPFNISRESFDSYRRSFDISARSPVLQPEQKSRGSLDSRTFLPPAPMGRTSNQFQRPLQQPVKEIEEEDNLEDVPLEDPKPQQQKKRSMFSRMLESSDSTADRPSSQPDGHSKGSSLLHFPGRKRGQSGQGAELGSIPKREETPKPAESNLRKVERIVTPQAQAPPQSQAAPGAENIQAPVANGES